MTISNKRKNRYKKHIYINRSSIMRGSYRITGVAVTLKDGSTEYVKFKDNDNNKQA